MLSESEKSRLKVGQKEVKKLVANRMAEKVFIASDCDDAISDSIKKGATDAGAQVVTVETMKELGRICGIDVGASCAAVEKLGS